MFHLKMKFTLLLILLLVLSQTFAIKIGEKVISLSKIVYKIESLNMNNEI